MEKIDCILRAFVKCLVKGYRVLIGSLLPPRCRFYPTCSQYALDALSHYCFWKAVLAIFVRIVRCHPWSLGGYDPVNPNNIKENDHHGKTS